MGLPWVDEHPDVFSELPELREDDTESPRLTAAHYRAREQNVVTSSGDSGHIASDQEEEAGDEYEDTLSTEGIIISIRLFYSECKLLYT